MRDRSDRYRVQTVPLSSTVRKRLGSYLVEAGLLTTAQLDVALNDQKLTEQTTGSRMQLGEIVAARGWVKEQTIEYLMQKVVIPERQDSERSPRPRSPEQDTVQQHRPSAPQRSQPSSQNGAVAAKKETQTNGSGQNFVRRDIPIAKPLPPVKSNTDDVNWVG